MSLIQLLNNILTYFLTSLVNKIIEDKLNETLLSLTTYLLSLSPLVISLKELLIIESMLFNKIHSLNRK